MGFYRIQQQAQINSNNYEFNNQIFPNSANLNGNNGYLHGNSNNANAPSSPLSNNALLNSVSATSNGATSFNSLNLSTRSNPSNLLASNLNIHQSNSLYPTNASTRLSNISPSLNFANLHTTQRLRFQAAKGFDIEDDQEFCPEIQDFLSHSHTSTASSTNTSMNFTHYKFNPYTSSTFSPQVSPTSSAALTVSPPSSKIAHTILNSTPKQETSSNGKNITPRAKKVLEIVNPITGLRVTSPTPYK